MKKFLTYCLILSFIIIAGSLAIKFMPRSQADQEAANTQTIQNVKQGIVWGVTTSAFQVDGYNRESATKLVDLLTGLNINTVRITLEREISLKPFSVDYAEEANDDFINKLSASGKDIVLVMDGDILGTMGDPSVDAEAEGYKIGAYAAKRYGTKVKYFQIANEVTGTITKPANFDGPTFKGDYDQEFSTDRYNATFKWLKGLSAGVRDNSSSKIIVSGHWTCHYVISKMLSDGLNFDILGWAFYSSDGSDMTKRDIGNGQSVDLLAKLKAIGKPVWVIEANRDKGSYTTNSKQNGEQLQAEYIEQLAVNVLKTGQVDGFFVYPLIDTPSFANPKLSEDETHWGLVSVTKDESGRPVYRKKEAYYRFSNLIRNYLNSLQSSASSS